VGGLITKKGVCVREGAEGGDGKGGGEGLNCVQIC